MRVINFNAGPAGLPLPALERAQKEFVEFGKTGMSIMEHSHRGKDYDAVHNEAIALLKELLDVPETHEVIFMQGGAHLQFSLIPMNFLPKGKSADYISTGHWSKMAISEAKALSSIVGDVHVPVSTEVDGKFTRIPKQDEIHVDPNAAYVHYTSNNTIYGTQWHYTPDVGNVPLVCDMSSDFIWKKFDVSKYALAYAGAQKNIGPSGVVVLIAKKDFINSGRSDLSKTLKISTYMEKNSLFNTPPTFAIYMVRNVLSWVKDMGGIDAIHARNMKKGEILYGALDAMSDFYKSPVEKDSRSYMNVVFRLPTEELEAKFVAEAKENNMVGLKGHRAVGGIRASIYNAVSVENIEALVSFMEKFKKANS
jgi:phosphoserine aminotransferase